MNLTASALRLVAALLACLLATTAWAQDAEAPPADDGFPAFLTEFRKVAGKRDCTGVAALTRFPFTSYDLAGKLPLKKGETTDPLFDRSRFLKACAKLLDKQMRRRLVTGKPTRRDSDEPEEGWYSLGIWGGKTWTAWLDFRKSPDEAGGAWRLTGTDNVIQ